MSFSPSFFWSALGPLLGALFGLSGGLLRASGRPRGFLCGFGPAPGGFLWAVWEPSGDVWEASGFSLRFLGTLLGLVRGFSGRLEAQLPHLPCPCGGFLASFGPLPLLGPPPPGCFGTCLALLFLRDGVQAEEGIGDTR